MLNAEIRKQLAIGSLAGAVLLGSSQGGFAHTTIEATATEGTTAYNSLQIGHGCSDPVKVDANGNAVKYPIIAEVALFPTLDANGTMTEVTASSTGTVNGVANANIYAADAAGATLATTITNADGLAGLVAQVQDRNVFTQQDQLYNGDGTNNGTNKVIGFYGKTGKLQTNLRARIPFRLTPPAFTTDNTKEGYCVKNLKVKIAVADICKLSSVPKDGQANLWIPNANAIFTDGAMDGSSPATKNGAPATLTIARQTQTGAWATYCDDSTAQKTKRDVIFWPNDTWVEQNLKIPRTWVPKAP